MTMNKKPSINDVAKQAGVSKPIAWAVLNPERDTNYRYSNETKKKVLQAAEEIGYRPNITAQNFFRRRHGTIGVLVPIVRDIPSSTLARMLHETSSRGMMLVMEEIPEKRSEVPRMIKEDCVDAVILFGTPRYKWYNRLDSLGIPVIEVNTNRRKRKGCITYDEEEACRTAVQYFADRKNTVPLYVFRDTPRYHYSCAVRKKSFIHESEAAGLNIPLMCKLHEEQGAEEVSACFRKHQEIDSILLYSTNLAPQVYAGISREGRTPGTDLSILGFGHAEMAKVMSPPLSTLTVDVKELGITIIERICAQLDGDDPAGPWVIPYELIERKT